MDRPGDWLQTFSGGEFWPLDPKLEEIVDEDLAHALSLECRFGGHCIQHYSVGDHSLRVMDLLVSWGEPLFVQLAGLVHDAPEGLGLKDLPRPLKHVPELQGYRDIETMVHRAVNAKYGLPSWAHSWPAVKNADNMLLATERRDLMHKGRRDWALRAPPLPEVIVPRAMTWVEAEFLRRLKRLHAAVGTLPGLSDVE